MQDKKPYNEKRQRHGYWEVYYSNGDLYFKTKYINNQEYGFATVASIFGQLTKLYYAR